MARLWVRKWGTSGTNLIVSYTEHQFFNRYNGPEPELYRRFIDDCIGATSSIREELSQLITAVNSFHPALKYTLNFLNFGYFLSISGYQSFYRRQRSMHHYGQQAHRFSTSYLFVVL